MSLAQRMLAAFEGSKVAHGTTTVGKTNRKGKAEGFSQIVREPLTEEIMQGHIDGKQGIGAIPINEENKCKWGALDIDVYDLDHNKLQARIQKLELPLLHCRSKSGGAHLYLFLKEYEPASVVREYLTEMAVALGHSGCEVFPKQDTILSDRGDVGNFINLPYFNAEFPQRYCFNKGVEAMELDEFMNSIEAKTVGLSDLEKVQSKKKRKWFTDGAVCMEILSSDGPSSEDRNKKLFMAGVYCRLKHADDWVREFEMMNQQLFDPPLEAKEVVGLQNSLSKKDYHYTCEQEPFKSFCDKEKCMSRRYGIGDEDYVAVEVSGLLIQLSDPRLYFLTVAGKRVQLNTEQLQTQQLFQRACIDQIQVAPPILSARMWQSQLRKLLNEATTQDVPEELTLAGEFKELLETYCTSKIRAMHPEELLAGKPWTDNQGYTSFMISGLMDFLSARRFKAFTRAQVQEILKDMNDGQKCHGHKSINKADGSRSTVRVWWVPAFENKEVNLPVKEIENDIPF